MKKTNRVFKTITISILLLFSIAILGTYLSDYLDVIDWYGDYDVTYYSDYRERVVTDSKWGARHYWYNWGVSLLFITSLARAVFKVVMVIEDKD